MITRRAHHRRSLSVPMRLALLAGLAWLVALGASHAFAYGIMGEIDARVQPAPKPARRAMPARTPRQASPRPILDRAPWLNALSDEPGAFCEPVEAIPAPVNVSLGGEHSHVEVDVLVDRDLWAEWTRPHAGLVRYARIIPNTVDGKSHGFKFVSIQPFSPHNALGFENGDLLLMVNGAIVNSPNKALEVFERLSTGNPTSMTLLRQGRLVTYHYEIK